MCAIRGGHEPRPGRVHRLPRRRAHRRPRPRAGRRRRRRTLRFDEAQVLAVVVELPHRPQVLLGRLRSAPRRASAAHAECTTMASTASPEGVASGSQRYYPAAHGVATTKPLGASDGVLRPATCQARHPGCRNRAERTVRRRSTGRRRRGGHHDSGKFGHVRTGGSGGGAHGGRGGGGAQGSTAALAAFCSAPSSCCAPRRAPGRCPPQDGVGREVLACRAPTRRWRRGHTEALGAVSSCSAVFQSVPRRAARRSP